MDRRMLVKSLKEAGLKRGDTVLVHSNIAMCGLWDIPTTEIPEEFREGFFEVIGCDGTLAVPAYFYEYARQGIRYDIKKSPVSKELGIFAAYINSRPNSYRSANPITAIAAVGKNADWITSGETAASYGYDTPWDRMLRMNAKMIFLGIDARAMTFIHFIEHQTCVPYMYNKLYETPITCNDIPINLPVCCFVRYLAYSVEYDFAKLERVLCGSGLINKIELGRHFVRCINFQDAFHYLINELKKDYYFLLKHPPKFEAGKIPLV